MKNIKRKIIFEKILKEIQRFFKKIFYKFIFIKTNQLIELKDITKINFTQQELEQQTQINKNINLFEDRMNELCEFYNLSCEEIKSSYKDLDDLNNKMINVLNENFKEIDSHKDIVQALSKSADYYIKNLMLSYTRLDYAFELLNYFDYKYTKKQKNKLNVLDYGCAVADYALAFALDGYKVTICDIENGNLEFAKFRLNKRNLKYNFIPINEETIYPDFKNFDIIIAGEILEHLQEPLIVCKNIYQSLPKSGYLWLSSYPYDEKELVGDHVLQAAEQRIDVLNFIQENFVLEANIAFGYLLRRK